MILNEAILKKIKPLDPIQRLYQLPKPIIAITGGIAVGKSSVVKMLRAMNQAVICADELIKTIYQKGPIAEWLQNNQPNVIDAQGKINFTLLRSHFFSNEAFKQELESMLYAELPQTFKDEYQKYPSHDFIFYEVPLLIEKKLYPFVDLIVLIHSNLEIQKSRLDLRDASSKSINEKIIQVQTPYVEKKKYAHIEIINNGTENDLLQNVSEMQIFVANIFSVRKK